jgi:hypothetical protein
VQRGFTVKVMNLLAVRFSPCSITHTKSGMAQPMLGARAAVLGLLLPLAAAIHIDGAPLAGPMKAALARREPVLRLRGGLVGSSPIGGGFHGRGAMPDLGTFSLTGLGSGLQLYGPMAGLACIIALGHVIPAITK